MIPSTINVDSRFTKYTLYRLLIPQVIPDDRVLYIDSDVIANNDIGEFYNMDFQNNLIIGCEDIGLMPGYKTSIGLCEDDKYINAGVCLMNLDEIRKLDIIDSWIELANNQYYLGHDQDILNITCKDKIGLVDFKYNTSLSTGLNINESDIKIMHYAGIKTDQWVKKLPFSNIWDKWENEYVSVFGN